MTIKENFMKKALDLARRGSGKVAPNPLVGALVVKDGQVIGQGWHKLYGGPHAEVHALANTKTSPDGAELYVTLEPCCHQGKTPPCTDLIIRSGISKVYVAMEDPNPLVAGKGIKQLREADIHVEVGLLGNQAKHLNRVFIKHMTDKKPYVVMKSAMSMDGKTTDANGGTCQISCPRSSKMVHQMRHDLSAIMVGIGTVMTDDPRLTCRLDRHDSVDPIPIIIDPEAQIQAQAAVFSHHPPNRILLVVDQSSDVSHLAIHLSKGCQLIRIPSQEGLFNLNDLMDLLYAKGIDSILLEGGSILNASAQKAGIVDEVVAFIAPMIIGGEDAKTPVAGPQTTHQFSPVTLRHLETQVLEEDVMIRWMVEKADKERNPLCSQASSKKSAD